MARPPTAYFDSFSIAAPCVGLNRASIRYQVKRLSPVYLSVPANGTNLYLSNTFEISSVSRTSSGIGFFASNSASGLRFRRRLRISSFGLGSTVGVLSSQHPFSCIVIHWFVFYGLALPPPPCGASAASFTYGQPCSNSIFSSAAVGAGTLTF